MLWVLASIILTVGVVAAYCIPVSMVESNAIDSVNYNYADRQSIVNKDDTTEASTTTVSIMLSMATHCDDGPLASAMRGGYYLDDEIGVDDSVRLGVHEECNRHYEWYWHGWIVLLKPMLMLMDYGGIKRLCWILFVFLLTLLTVRLSSNSRKGLWFGIALGASIMYTGANAIDCLPYGIPLLLAITVSISLTYVDYGSPLNKLTSTLLSIFLIAGCLTCYLDFLVTPLITFILPATVCTIYLQRCQWTEEPAIWLKLFAKMGLAWMFGYGGMFLGRWVIASIVLRENVVSLGLNQVLFRMGTEGVVGNSHADIVTQANGLEIGPINSILLNLKTMFPVNTTMFCAIGIVLVVVLLGVSIRRQKSLIAFTLLLCACLPLLWYAVLPNHSMIHYYFTFRLLIGSVFAVAVLAITSITAEELRCDDNGMAG